MLIHYAKIHKYIIKINFVMNNNTLFELSDYIISKNMT